MRGIDFEQEFHGQFAKSLERKYNRTESHLRNLDVRVAFIPYFLGKGLAAYWAISRFHVLCKLLKRVGFMS